VRTLTRAPHNIATLYLLPEVQGEEFASFRAEHAELQATCGRLGRAAAAKGGSLDEELTATLIMRLVESVVQLRRFGELRDGYAREIALSCLRRIGLDPRPWPRPAPPPSSCRLPDKAGPGSCWHLPHRMAGTLPAAARGRRDLAARGGGMGAIAVILAARSRRHWRAWLALALLVALGTGLVLAATTAGRRADSAFPRFAATGGLGRDTRRQRAQRRSCRRPIIAAPDIQFSAATNHGMHTTARRHNGGYLRTRHGPGRSQSATRHGPGVAPDR
jgi:hypothetical protein